MPKHDFYLDRHGEIDVWRMDSDYHNGPECRRCGDIWCEHCEQGVYEEECPNGQLDLF